MQFFGDIRGHFRQTAINRSKSGPREGEGEGEGEEKASFISLRPFERRRLKNPKNNFLRLTTFIHTEPEPRSNSSQILAF